MFLSFDNYKQHEESTDSFDRRRAHVLTDELNECNTHLEIHVPVKIPDEAESEYRVEYRKVYNSQANRSKWFNLVVRNIRRSSLIPLHALINLHRRGKGPLWTGEGPS